ncbi:hypothetical protein MRB53_025955 [Persea americana]|uniref:Uncharacterized protein n=1 Tax=Persea americana TaxID=3435 RepID=A0ACC2LGU4_PERAE|nr:hypothetical protein MRB53_025955 [Persea americana]
MSKKVEVLSLPDHGVAVISATSSPTIAGTLDLGEPPISNSLEPKTSTVVAPTATPSVSVALEQTSHGMKDTGLNHNSTPNDLQQINNQQAVTMGAEDATWNKLMA